MTDEPLFQRGIQYQQNRPGYPARLFGWLAEHSIEHQLALDMGCGTGQATRGLEPYYKNVIGADISVAQLQAATASDATYLACQAHSLPLRPHCLDLITVAQAFHWFDKPAFFTEAGRCLKPQGVVALISYGVCEVDGVTSLIQDFHDSLLGRWWPPQRVQVISGYQDVTLPWQPLPFNEDAISRSWQVQDMLGYLDTWSALVKARAAGCDPLQTFRPLLIRAWGDQARTVRWPLRVKAWRKP